MPVTLTPAHLQTVTTNLHHSAEYFTASTNYYRPTYCTSFYRCELRNLSCSELGDLCTAWRKDTRRVWSIPPDIHCYIIQLLCKCLPVFDEICRRSANFVRSRMVHNRNVVQSVANYGILFGWCESHNVSIWCCLSDILSGKFDTSLRKHTTFLLSRNTPLAHYMNVLMIHNGVFTLPIALVGPERYRHTYMYLHNLQTTYVRIWYTCCICMGIKWFHSLSETMYSNRQKTNT